MYENDMDRFSDSVESNCMVVTKSAGSDCTTIPPFKTDPSNGPTATVTKIDAKDT